MMREHAETDEEIKDKLPELTVTMDYLDGEQHVFANGEDVTALIRTEAVSMAASRVSALPAVRKFLFRLQQSLAEQNPL